MKFDTSDGYPLNEQRCGVYPSCVDHFHTDTMVFPWLFHISVSLPRGVSPSCREVREESLGRRSHDRSHVTRRVASPSPWFFQHPEMRKWVPGILAKIIWEKMVQLYSPLVYLVYLVSGRFILLGKSSNLSDLRPYWNMAFDAQNGKYKNDAERRSVGLGG